MRKSNTISKPQQRFLRQGIQSSKGPLSHGQHNKLVRILSTPPKDRSSEQVQDLVHFTKSISFFAELSAKIDPEAHLQCCQYMTQKYCDAGEVISKQFVFHALEVGNQFYVIFSGSVSVLAPNEVVDGDRSYRQLAVLSEGGSFEELALIRPTPHVTSVLCREPTFLGVLERQDYLRILGKAQELQLSKKVELMQSNPLFSRWTKGSLQKFSCCFTERSFQRKQVLVHSGQPATEVFLVKSGDFELTKEISIKVRKSATQLKELELTHCQAEVTLVSIGEMIGGVEVVKNIPHVYTCVCYSTQAEVFCVSKDEFMKRIGSEEMVKFVLALNEVVEGQRGQRLQTISNREIENRDMNSFLYTRSLTNGTGPSNTVLNAKLDLEANVRSRWHLGKREEQGKSQSHLPKISSIMSHPASPVRSPEPEKRVISPVHTRMWSQIMEQKFRKRKSVEGLHQAKPVINIHMQKMRTESPTYELLYQVWMKTGSESPLDFMRSELSSRIRCNATPL